MDLTMESRLIRDLKMADLNGMKPNYAELGRIYDIDWRTVKKYHQGYKGKPENRNKPSKLDPYKELIKQKLALSRTSVTGVYESLVDLYGIEKIGSLSNFRYYVKKHNLKPKNRNRNVGTARFETNPGELAEIDWKEDIKLTSKNGEVFIINIMHVLLKFSRFSYIELSLFKERVDVINLLINAFMYFGGVPKRLLFDNMSSVVDVGKKKFNPEFKQFGKDFGFEMTKCKVRHAFTKGSNEARNKILDWFRAKDHEFQDYNDLVRTCEIIMDKMNTQVCQGTGITPSLLYYKEKEYFNPLPDKEIIRNYRTEAKFLVGPDQLVDYQGSKYSVDKSLIGEYVLPKLFDNKLVIYYKSKIIEVHSLSENPVNYKKEHYLQTLGGKVKSENIEKVAEHNLKIMDTILEQRKVTINKEDAVNSLEGLAAYISCTRNEWLRRFFVMLTKEEKEIFFEQMKIVFPHVNDEKVLFEALKNAVKKEYIDKTAAILWKVQADGSHTFISEKGFFEMGQLLNDEIMKLYEESYKKGVRTDEI